MGAPRVSVARIDLERRGAGHQPRRPARVDRDGGDAGLRHRAHELAHDHDLRCEGRQAALLCRARRQCRRRARPRARPLRDPVDRIAQTAGRRQGRATGAHRPRLQRRVARESAPRRGVEAPCRRPRAQRHPRHLGGRRERRRPCRRDRQQHQRPGVAQQPRVVRSRRARRAAARGRHARGCRRPAALPRLRRHRWRWARGHFARRFRRRHVDVVETRRCRRIVGEAPHRAGERRDQHSRRAD